MPEFEMEWPLTVEDPIFHITRPPQLLAAAHYLTVRGYVEAMLFANVMDYDDETNELEFVAFTDAGQIQRSTLRTACEELADFVSANFKNLEKFVEETDGGWPSVGCNFAMSRNGHGTGFFDSGSSVADELQEAAKVYGECTWYVYDILDDGTVGL